MDAADATLARLLLLQHEVDAFNADYGAALDEGRLDDWVALFTAQCRYTVRARENHARGLPLALIDLESQGMLRDRVYGITQTIYHGPYYSRHVIGCARITGHQPAAGGQGEGETVQAEAAYAVFRTRPGGISEVYNVGRYIDTLVRQDGVLRLASRLCVYDSELVLNSLIAPI